MKFLKNWLENRIVNKYIEFGTEVGDIVSYCYIGEPVGMEELVDKWIKFEKKYVALGYRTISLDDFVEHGGYGKPINDLVRVKCTEDPFFHAQLYKDKYLGKLDKLVFVDEDDGQVITGTFITPSTKVFEERKKSNVEL